jgi:hypothetical protein
MKRNIGKIPEPFNVEMPLAHVLIDKLDMYLADLEYKEQQTNKQRT